MSQKTESVNKLLADLHAHRVATFKPEDLAVNVNQRQLLVDTANRATFLKVGDVVDSFTLAEVDGDEVELDALLARGPAILVFFRFAGCPACNLALPYYQRQLFPALAALGATLVAISPQVPEKLRDIKDRHKLEFFVASDKDNRLGRKFGIVFTADQPSQAAARVKGTDMGDVTGTGTWDLPMPAVIVIDQQHVVRFVEISPDWLVRAEAEDVLAAVRKIEPAQKAA